LSGNTDTAAVVTAKLRPPLFAKKIRVLPYAKHRRTVCMRIELLGCVSKGKISVGNFHLKLINSILYWIKKRK
jgi:discoidin domain receptor family protein 2